MLAPQSPENPLGGAGDGLWEGKSFVAMSARFVKMRLGEAMSGLYIPGTPTPLEISGA